MTRASGRKPSGEKWHSTVCTCPFTRPGFRISSPQLLSFPAGKFDDQVDALSLIGQMQTRITRGRVPEPKAKLKVLTVGDPDTQEPISLDDLWDYDSGSHRRERV